jgi:hypothetical protein
VINNVQGKYFIFFCIAAGIFLRLNWNADMEWKADEQWTYEKAHETAASGTIPAAGMQSGGGLVNPGLSLGIFALIASFTNDPLSMNRVVQLINILAILCFAWFALTKLKAGERQVWLYGIALASVSPLAVLFARKIWAQDLLPLVSFMVLLGNYYRHKSAGAFAWGLFGALIGQIHMSGFFFAAGIFVFTLLHDRYNKIKFRWMPWLLGSVLGSITIVMWLLYMAEHPQFTRFEFIHLLQFNFYIYWFLDAHGLNIMYSTRKEFWELIKEPVIFGLPAYSIAIVHLYLAATGIFTLKEIIRYVKILYLNVKQKTFAAFLFSNVSVTKFYLLSILLGLGVFMNFSGFTVHPHYLICAFPFVYIFLAKVFEKKTLLLKGIIIAQLFITVMFQVYVHQHNGIKDGDYGMTYKAQMQLQKPNQ